MEGFNQKIVEFENFCKACKHYDITPTSEPCNECLGIPARIGSHKPEKYEPKKKGGEK